ncbi:hypothetical protein KM043_009603 [Ampulex compressa]|nr:hypothetical protein KM043_009603 [Ampulex compressa]
MTYRSGRFVSSTKAENPLRKNGPRSFLAAHVSTASNPKLSGASRNLPRISRARAPRSPTASTKRLVDEEGPNRAEDQFSVQLRRQRALCFCDKEEPGAPHEGRKSVPLRRIRPP